MVDDGGPNHRPVVSGVAVPVATVALDVARCVVAELYFADVVDSVPGTGPLS